LRFTAGFREEVDKFIEAAEKHATTLTQNNGTIIYPCFDCKNLMAFSDVFTIRSHLIVRRFILDYTVWIHHGEITIVDDDDVDQEDNAETLQYLSQFLGELRAQMDHDFGNEQGGDDAGSCHQNSDDGGVDNDGRAHEGDAEDFDNLEDMVRALGPEILKSKKGLENLERVTKALTETVYGVEKGCPSHWTLLHFVLELLILKAKYGWSDYCFNDLLRLLSWLLPQPNSVPTNTYQAKKVISPLTMGVEKNPCMPQPLYPFSW
jgi:hypothetical protein